MLFFFSCAPDCKAAAKRSWLLCPFSPVLIVFHGLLACDGAPCTFFFKQVYTSLTQEPYSTCPPFFYECFLFLAFPPFFLHRLVRYCRVFSHRAPLYSSQRKPCKRRRRPSQCEQEQTVNCFLSFGLCANFPILFNPLFSWIIRSEPLALEYRTRPLDFLFLWPKSNKVKRRRKKNQSVKTWLTAEEKLLTCR